MKKIPASLALTAGIWLALSATSAQAVPQPCQNGDVTLDNPPAAAANTPASACLGAFQPFSGSPSDELQKLLDEGGFGYSDWEYKDKTDAASEVSTTGSLAGISFTITAPTNTSSGDFTVAWADTNGTTPVNFPLILDLTFSFKASTGIAFYLFENLLFVNDGSGGGSFTTRIANDRGRLQDLSHASLFARYDRTPTTCEVNPNDPSCGGGGGGGVPEPGILGLFGLGLLSMRFLQKKRA